MYFLKRNRASAASATANRERRKLQRRRFLRFESLEDRRPLAANLELLKDINQTASTAGSTPRDFLQVGAQTYFIAETPTHGAELWKTDGTSAGTALIKDLTVGVGSPLPTFPEMEAVGGTVFFTAFERTTGWELWKTDGTAAGTVLVKDIAAAEKNSNPEFLTNVNGTLYFAANDGGSLVFGIPIPDDRELWKTDGTASGTVLVKDLYLGRSSSPRELVNANGTLMFAATDFLYGNELWKSDGTPAGTVMVRDINPFYAGSYPQHLTVVGNRVFFAATTSYLPVQPDPPAALIPHTANGTELWVYDMTSGNTFMTLDIALNTIIGSNAPTAANPIPRGVEVRIQSSSPENLVNVSGVLYFTAEDNTRGRELWRVPAAATTPAIVADIFPGVAYPPPRPEPNTATPAFLTNVSGSLYFRANNGVSGAEVWRVAGGAPTQLADIYPGAGGSLPTDFVNVNGTLFFRAEDGVNGYELWKANGAAVTMVSDIVAGMGGSEPDWLFNGNGKLLFSADDGVHGRELWSSDGTNAGTSLLKDIVSGNANAEIKYETNVNGVLYFSATDGLGGHELWKTDGTPGNTVLVKDIYPGATGSYPKYMTNVGGVLFFSANDPTGEQRLWKSDGTDAGTVLVKDVYSGAFRKAGSPPASFVNVNGTFFFTADDGLHGYELWKSDGTEFGTVQVRDIYLGTSSSDPRHLINVNGTLFFTARDSEGDFELWASNGSDIGTYQVKDIFPGELGSSPKYLTNVSGTLFFQATDNFRGEELWKSDGSSAGTVLVSDINSIGASGSPRGLTNVNGILYFSASNTNQDGEELWRSDGTAVGTWMVKNIYNDPPIFDPIFPTVIIGKTTNSSSPRNLVNVAGTLYFIANNGPPVSRYQLWKSDGTTAGTVFVSDIVSSTSNSPPKNLTNVNSVLYFTARNSFGGEELWTSDGTGAGTVTAFEFTGDSGGGNPRIIPDFNNKLLVVATTETIGEEFWIEADVPLAPTLNSLVDPDPINEDALEQLMVLTGIAPGVGASNVTITAVSSNPAIVPHPTVTYTSPGVLGVLRYTPVSNQNGSVVITVTAMDDGGTGGGRVDTVTRTFTVVINPVNDVPSFTILASPSSSLEDAPLQTVLNFATSIVPGPADALDEVSQTVTFQVTNNTNSALFVTQPAISPTGTLTYRAAANRFGSATITVVMQDSGSGVAPNVNTTAPQTFTITVLPVGDTPETFNAETTEDTMSARIPVVRNALDGDEVTHFHISGISFGTLFKSDGVTLIANGDYITVAEGLAGLRFLPAPNSFVTGRFDAESSENGTSVAAQSAKATYAIKVNPVGDTPQVASITTVEDTVSGPIVINRNAADSLEVTYFRISGIAGGSLFKNNGVTRINDGDFIPFADGQAGLRFLPLPNSVASGTFDVESSQTGTSVSPQSGKATSTITVTPVGDTPQVTNITTLEDTLSGLILIQRHAQDGAEVTHFKISGISGGVLYKSDGTTVVNNGDFLTVAEGAAGVRFLPSANSVVPGRFDAESSQNGASVAAQSGKATSTITITPIGDTPRVASVTTLEDALTAPIIVNRHLADGAEVTHFLITGITGGTLFAADGLTRINNGDFISFAEGQAGLRFKPNPNSNVAGQFSVEASENGVTVAAQSGKAISTVTVTPVGDTPRVGNATTLEDTMTAAIVIQRHAADGGEVTHFKITGIANGTLFKNDGTTRINNGDFITFAEGQAGVKFLPAPNSTLAGKFDVEASQDGATIAAQSGKATSTITVTPDPFQWHNDLNPLDVNGDGNVVPEDVLLIINELLERSYSAHNGALPTNRPAGQNVPLFDVTRDGFIAPDDALKIINFLNGVTGGEAGEGEGTADDDAAPTNAAPSSLQPAFQNFETRRAVVSLNSLWSSPIAAASNAESKPTLTPRQLPTSHDLAKGVMDFEATSWISPELEAAINDIVEGVLYSER